MPPSGVTDPKPALEVPSSCIRELDTRGSEKIPDHVDLQTKISKDAYHIRPEVGRDMTYLISSTVGLSRTFSVTSVSSMSAVKSLGVYPSPVSVLLSC